MYHSSTPLIIVLRNLFIVSILYLVYSFEIVNVNTEYVYSLAVNEDSVSVNPALVDEVVSPPETMNIALLPTPEKAKVVAPKAPPEISHEIPPKKVAEIAPSVKVVGKLDKSLPTPRRYYQDYEIVIWMLKSYESFSPVAYYDVSQFTCGWGVKCKKGEKQTVKQADQEFLGHFNKVYNAFIAEYPNIAKDKFLSYILSNALYNVGSFGDGMKKLLKEYDHNNNPKKHIKKITEKLKQYNMASGKVLQGLVNRRNAEASLLLADDIQRQQLGELYRRKVEKILQDALY